MKHIIIRWLLCLAAFIAAAVLIAYRGGAASYLLFWTVLLIPVSAGAYRWIITERLRAHFAIHDPTVLKGETTTGVLTVTNASVLPIVHIRLKLTEGKVRFLQAEREHRFSLMPGETKIMEYPLVCRHCGEAEVGALEICVGDLFALTQRRFSQLRRIRILPRTQHLQDLIIAPVGNTDRKNVQRSYFGDTVPDGQLKPYLPGEDVRRIHWKASALQGRPIMRNMVPEPKTEIVLLPDGRGTLPEGEARWLAEDSVVEGTLAIADYFLRCNMASRVIADESRVVNVFSPSHYLKLYDLCAGDFFVGSRRPDEMMEQDLASRAGKRSYILLTWEMDETLVRRCGMCLDLGSDVTVVYIGDDAGARKLAGADRRIAFHQVTGQQDIFAVLGGIRTAEDGAQ